MKTLSVLLTCALLFIASLLAAKLKPADTIPVGHSASQLSPGDSSHQSHSLSPNVSSRREN